MRLSGLGVALALVLCGCGTQPPAAVVSASPVAMVPPAPLPVDNLKQARALASRGDWRAAASFAREALQTKLNESDALEARGILLETSLRIGDYRGARELLAAVTPEEREGLARQQLLLARQALDGGKYPDAILRARTVQEIEPAAHEVLARAYLATNQTELALAELKHVPGSGPQMQLLREEVADRARGRSVELAGRQLSLAQMQAEHGQWGQAAVAARKAGAMFERMGGHKGERALAAFIEAQEAASRGEFKAAARLTSQAVALDPRAEYKSRLAFYQEKDRLLVSRDEIVDVESFQFPPTAEEGKPRDSLYLLGSTPDDPIVGGRELVYNAKETRFSATGDAMVNIKTDGPGRDFWNLVFTGPARADLKPGLYARAGSEDPDAAALDISGCERGAGHSIGKFQVYEVVYGPKHELQRFAADFVVSADGHKPFFGKVRYHSRYR